MGSVSRATASVAVAAVVVLTGCSASSSPHGCYTAQSAMRRYLEAMQGIQKGTATAAESAARLKKVSDTLGDVALIAGDPLKGTAQDASDIAGRLHVGLAGGGGTPSVSDVTQLDSDMSAIAADCPPS